MNWEELRTQWVNGNRADVKQTIDRMTRASFIHLVMQALSTSMDLNHESGDMRDLREILNYVQNRMRKV